MIQHSDISKFSFLWITYRCNMFCGLRQRRRLFNWIAGFRHHRCVYHWGSHLLFNSIGCECGVQDPCERKGTSVNVYQQHARHTVCFLWKGVSPGVVFAQRRIQLYDGIMEARKTYKEFIVKTCSNWTERARLKKRKKKEEAAWNKKMFPANWTMLKREWQQFTGNMFCLFSGRRGVF